MMESKSQMTGKMSGSSIFLDRKQGTNVGCSEMHAGPCNKEYFLSASPYI